MLFEDWISYQYKHLILKKLKISLDTFMLMIISQVHGGQIYLITFQKNCEPFSPLKNIFVTYLRYTYA